MVCIIYFLFPIHKVRIQTQIIHACVFDTFDNLLEVIVTDILTWFTPTQVFKYILYLPRGFYLSKSLILAWLIHSKVALVQPLTIITTLKLKMCEVLNNLIQAVNLK